MQATGYHVITQQCKYYSDFIDTWRKQCSQITKPGDVNLCSYITNILFDIQNVINALISSDILTIQAYFSNLHKVVATCIATSKHLIISYPVLTELEVLYVTLQKQNNLSTSVKMYHVQHFTTVNSITNACHHLDSSLL